MNDVYKRQPIVHKLPVGWNDLDNVKFTNMNSIKGLQHVDNPLVAEQNSTYDCKNVYQDESNNLTVRPALRFTKNVPASDLCGYYKTSKGEIVITNKAGAFFLNNTPVGNAHITVQENDGHVYVMYTGLDNKLAFAEYDGYGLVQIEPDILANNPDSIVKSLYNLLTNQIKYETVPNLRQDSTVGLNLYTEFESRVISEEILDAKLLSDGSVLTIHPGQVKLWYLLGRTWSVTNFDVTITALDPFSKETLLIQNDSSKSGVILKTVSTDGRNVTLTRYTLTYKGSINRTVEHFTLKPTYEYIDDGVLAVYPLYDDNRVLAIYSTVGGNRLTAYIHNVTGTGISYATLTGTIGNDWSEPTAAGYIHVEISRDAIGLRTRNYQTDAGKIAYILSSSDLSDLGYEFEYLRADNIYLSGSNAGIYAITVNGTIYSGGTKLHINATTTIDLPEADSFVMQAVGSDISVYIPQATDIRYYSARDGLFVFDMPKSTDLAAIANSGQVLLSISDKNELLTRSLLPQYKYEDREVSDEFPVLSQIEDEVLTSFYLDNMYWFVTKRRVFGTGVADGRFSIKYFDPKKYFYFDEELTGAIRVSDSSFWVFHNSGAYLIYKSTAEMYDQLSQQYIETITWLCTNTAKSKGCDFDNALTVLPTSNYIACVTSDDISVVRLLENVQSDERVLAPLTLNLSKFVSGLLHVTKDVKIATYKYNTIFFLNPQNENGIVPALVYNIVTESWWYWEFPFDSITQVYNTEENIDLIAKIGDNWAHYDLYTEYYDHTVGALTYHIYGDRLPDGPAKIDWFWDSAILHFNTTDYKKQLLAVNFTFAERESCSISFDYNFAIYDREYSSCSWSEITNVVERVNTYSRKNVISKFAYLQICLRSPEKDDEWESYTRPKFSTISLKYRILPGGI